LFENIRRLRAGARQPLILMYHRIAAPAVDPWGLAVRPEHFEQHLRVLRSRTVLSMSEFVDRLERRTLPGNAVAITFDDGYVDNLREAKPRLAAAGMPATLFVTTGAVGQGTEYWWDELARAILLHRGPLDRQLLIGADRYHLAFSNGDRTVSAWRAWEPPPGARQAAYLAVWRRLRDTPARQRDTAMNLLRDLLDSSPPDANDLPMTSSEVADLAADGLFDIGGHTVTHPALPTLPPSEQADEILHGRLACEQIVNRAIAGFAYPHGALDSESRAAVRACGFRWACSTEARPVPVRDYDRYALPRLAVSDCDGPAFERALQAACA
jgi:peptidoglycan/xylan/chitin deacetylase (PgdA/CDA1 family)